MRTVKVSKVELLDTIERNRQNHVAAYDKALEGYWRTAKVEVEGLLEKVERKEWEGEHFLIVNLVMPQSHEDEYETAIRMLEWSTEAEVELTQQEFKQFVQDEWSWKQQFAATNSTYIA